MRRRTLRLLYSILKTKPFDQSRAVRRLNREIVDLVKTNLAQVLAIRFSPEARASREQWQEHLQAAAVDGRAYAREKNGPPQRSEAWDKIFALPDPWSCDSEYEAVKYEQTLALLPEGVFANALEIGCAEGHFTLRLAPRVGSLTAVDISPRALTRAKERCSRLKNVAFQRLDLNTSVVAGLFDLVVCSELLYYLIDLPGAIARVLGHVGPGGFFLPLTRAWWSMTQRAVVSLGIRSLLSGSKPLLMALPHSPESSCRGNFARLFTESCFTSASPRVNDHIAPQ